MLLPGNPCLLRVSVSSGYKCFVGLKQDRLLPLHIVKSRWLTGTFAVAGLPDDVSLWA
jgi:hypothetical protein